VKREAPFQKIAVKREVLLQESKTKTGEIDATKEVHLQESRTTVTVEIETIAGTRQKT
jgi:hypothetical protein